MDQGTASDALDLKTPINADLTGFYKRSFAFHTVKNRMPIIVTHIIDGLVRNKENISKTYGENASEEIKTVIGELSKLKYEIQTNKPIRKLNGSTWDIERYNKYHDEQSAIAGPPTYFNAIWLFSECHMYRKIREIIELTRSLKELDPFQIQKEQAFESSVGLMKVLGKHLLEVLDKNGNREEIFVKFLKLNLWGNKCDLSLSNGIVANETDQMQNIEELNLNILSDYSKDIWESISKDEESKIVDIVLDNSGYELFTDLCIADLIITYNYAKTVRFYVKTIPWFISDVMTKDFNWLLTQFELSDDVNLSKLGNRWRQYIESKIWTIEDHDFWTLPVPFREMRNYDLELYEKLSAAKLIIFKGDLNYRKLFGEKNWLPETPIVEGLQGFNPSKLCTLRTLKADIICGLSEGLSDEMEKKSKDWLTSGDFGVIQFCDKIIKIK